MNRWCKLCLALCTILATQQVQAQISGNLLMPPAVNMTRQGWDVSLQEGNLTLGLPITTVPGEVPVPVAFGMNATYLASAWVTRVYDPDAGRYLPVTNEMDRPMVGGIHFGYISDSATYSGSTIQGLTVLEDGNQIPDSSWTAFSTHANLGATLNLPQAYGFSAVSTSTAKVDSAASYLTYTTTASGLGSTYQTIVQGLTPSGFGAGSTSYKVVLDKNKARVYAYTTSAHAWVPVLWADRFGHYVTFQWVRSTTSLPTGITAITKVTVTNQRSKGVVLRWADYASNASVVDILRLDYVGMNAPSVLIKGYYGYAYVAPVAFVNDLYPDNQWTVVPSIIGSTCRPSSVEVGAFGNLAQPIWSGSGSPAAAPPGAPPADGTTAAASQTWSFVYDSNQAELTSYTEPRGLTTTFTYSNYAKLTGFPGTIKPRGVSQVDAVDLSLNKLSKRWTRTFPVGTSPLTVKLEGWWDPNQMVTPDRYHQIVFPSPSDTLNYGNGVHQTDTLMDTAGKTWSTTTYAYNPAGAGLNNTLSSVQSVAVQQDGGPKITTVLGYPDGANLQVTQQNVSATDAVGTSYMVSSTVNTYDTRWDMLEGHQLNQVVTTRYAPDGVLALPSVTQKYVYDTPASGPALLQLQKSYLDGGADGTLGKTVTYDTEGRPKSRANVASFSADAVATTTLTYGADGYPSDATTAYTRPANQTGAASISQGATYDSAGRALTQTDALGVQATFTYDTLGRVLTRSRQGEPSITYSYPDSRTRTLIQSGRTTTELTDGFGRLVRRSLPDGRRTEPTYDAYGRVVAQREFNTSGTASRASATSYDALDRPTLATSPGGASQSMSYALSADGRLAITTSSVAGVNVSRKEYHNALGQVVKVEEPTGGVTTMTYDGSGNLTIADTANGAQTRTFNYNALGLLTSKSEPETGTQVFSGFNALGKPTTVTEASGTAYARTRTILYDGLGRAGKVSSNTGADTVETFFDGALLTGATGGGASPVSMTFGYRPTTEGRRLAYESTTLVGVAHTLTYSYLGTGLLDTISYPSGRVVGYTYDVDSRITGIQDRTGGGSLALVSNVSFDDWGQRSRLTFGSTAYSDWSTQDLGTHLKDWTIGYTTGGLGDPANPRTHTYDLAERLTKAGEWQSILHDGANRLGHVEAPALGVTAIDLNHDVFGNNIKQDMSGASVSSFNQFSFNALPTNQLPTETNSTIPKQTDWVINGRGEALGLNQGVGTGRNLGLIWDALGRVSQVNTNFNVLQNHTYAPSGLRIRAIDTATPSNNRRYAYTNGGLLMSEYTDAGWKRDVVYLGSEAIAEIDVAGAHELHKDHLGTPRIVTNGSTAQIEGKQAYGPYGEYLQSQAAGYKPLTGYTGHLQNEPSDLIYMRGRFYSPAWHRFVNSDQGVDPNSWNQMAYVGGSPFMGTDPSGMMIGLFLGWATVVIDGESEPFDYAEVSLGGSNGYVPPSPPPGGGNPPGGGGKPPAAPKPPLTPKPAPKYSSFNDCLVKEGIERGILKDVAFAVGNGLSTLDPTGLSGLAVGTIQSYDAWNSSPLELANGGLGIAGGAAGAKNFFSGAATGGSIMNRGFRIQLGSSASRGLPGFNQAMGWGAALMSGVTAAVKFADTVKYCNQFDK